MVAGHRLKRAPKPSTAASFHGVPASRIAYYDTLTVEHPELDAPLEFCVHDPPHCALVLLFHVKSSLLENLLLKLLQHESALQHMHLVWHQASAALQIVSVLSWNYHLLLHH